MKPTISRLDEQLLRPFLSFDVLVLAKGQEASGADGIAAAVRSLIADRDNLTLVADGLANPGRVAKHAATLDVVCALAFRETRTPPWGGVSPDKSATDQLDQDVHLVLVVQRHRLLAVHATSYRVHDLLRVASANDPIHGTGHLSPEVLQTALLQGDIRTLWLGQGASRRRSGTRTKSMSGVSVDIDIDPIGDQRHTLSAARAAVTDDLLWDGASGSVGTSLERSSVWYRRARDWKDFLRTMERLLAALEDVITEGGGHDRFTVFAKKTANLDQVESAYEISFEDPTPLSSADEVDPDTVDAYDWLSSNIVGVEPVGRSGVRFSIVDDDGIVVTVRLVPTLLSRGKVGFDKVGIESGDSQLYTRARNAMGRLYPIIYYGSGHTVTSSGVVEEHFSDVSFGGWQFDPFEAVSLWKEKPSTVDGQSLLVTIGQLDATNADDSLFGWCIRHWANGWLYCDDRPDELFDFVHLDDSIGLVRIVHVKAAGRAQIREIAAGPYQEVCAQLQKNLVSLSRPRLINELQHRFDRSSVGPVWRNGIRTSDSAAFIAALRRPRASETYLATIVQPHVSDRMLMRTRSSDEAASSGAVGKLRRLEHLLVATDNLASRVAARLEVVAYQEPVPNA